MCNAIAHAYSVCQKIDRSEQSSILVYLSHKFLKLRLWRAA
jgi:hypothetical protein